MSIKESVIRKEASLISKLQEMQSGIDDRTGKGSATESIIEVELITPFLPLGFECQKGSVVTAEQPDNQSPAIDRVVFDRSTSVALLQEAAHSVFPIEAVAGLVEITMHLDATKLRDDIEKMAPVKAMKTRRYLAPQPGSNTKTVAVDKCNCVSPRSFIIGLPADENWSPDTIAKRLQKIQTDIGPPTLVHGLYVLGVGYFYTNFVENNTNAKYQVGSWTSADRLFRFIASFRTSFDRWPRMEPGWSVDWGSYVC